MFLIISLNINRVENGFDKRWSDFSLLFILKCYLYLSKSAELVIRTNCTVLSLNMTSPSLPSEQVKGKGLPQEAEVAQGVPSRLRPRIFLTFGTMRVIGRQP